MDKAEKIINIILKLVIVLAIIFFVKNDMDKAQNGRFAVSTDGLSGYIIDTHTGVVYRTIAGNDWTTYDLIHQSKPPKESTK
jgi:hypothetical protein